MLRCSLILIEFIIIIIIIIIIDVVAYFMYICCNGIVTHKSRTYKK